jgi:MoaA/NifB/PqqE/SkfB family radical SAM enzyme
MGERRRLRLASPPPDRGARDGYVQEVHLTTACDLACGFCTAKAVEPRSPRTRAAEAIARTREARARGGTTLVVSGAEPTGEWYLPDLIRLARAEGWTEVIVETHGGGLSGDGRARELKEAGLSSARVALNTLDAAESDAITGTVGAFARSVAGVRALLAEGVPAELATAVLPGLPDALSAVVAGAAALFPSNRASLTGVVARVVSHGPSLPAPFRIDGATRALRLAQAASARSGMPLRIAPGGDLPPCVFEDPDEAAPLLHLGEAVVKNALGRSDHVRIEACDACVARAVCPGVRRELEAEALRVARPLTGAAKSLPLAGVDKRVERELLSVVPVRLPDGTMREGRVLRINFHCNQACDFCFVSRELPAPSEARVLSEIEAAAKAGALLSVSGGEPTLNPRLLDYLARASSLGMSDLDLQTNAIKMSDAAYADALAGAGLRTAFVSLHGVTRQTGDRVTAAPGTWDKTIAGIKNLLAAGITARLNFVACGENLQELAEWPDFAARELVPHGPGRLELNVSLAAAMTDNVPRKESLLPRLTDLAAPLARAVERASALGLPLYGIDSQCGVPACMVPESVRERAFSTPLPAGSTDVFRDAFTRGAACEGCAMADRCYGVRAAYAEMYGTRELRRILR